MKQFVTVCQANSALFSHPHRKKKKNLWIFHSYDLLKKPNGRLTSNLLHPPHPFCCVPFCEVQITTPIIQTPKEKMIIILSVMVKKVGGGIGNKTRHNWVLHYIVLSLGLEILGHKTKIQKVHFLEILSLKNSPLCEVLFFCWRTSLFTRETGIVVPFFEFNADF